MRRVFTVSLFILGLFMAFNLTTTPAAAQQINCPGTPPSHLAVGVRGQVTKTPVGQTPAPVRLRDQPSKAGKVVAQLPDLTPFTVIDGPKCTDGYLWWQIKTDDGQTGWAAEGDKDGYFIEPLNPGPTHTPSPTAKPGAAPTQASTPTHNPALNKGGNKILYQHGDTRHHQIYVMNDDGTSPVALTPDSVDSGDAVWSPDGEQIAYIQDDRAIYTINSDGANQHLVAPDPQPKAHLLIRQNLTWAPGGQQLVFTQMLVPTEGSSTDEKTTWMVNIDGSEPPRLILPETTQLSWSPDGKRSVYVTRAYSKSTGTSAIVIANPDGSEPKLLTTEGYDPSWSPDGGKIMFMTGGYGADTLKFSIYTINPDGSNLVKLISIDTASHVSAPTWSPRGKYIAFWVIADQMGGSTGDIVVMNADGSRVLNITRMDDSYYVDNINGSLPVSWSPDGQNIVYEVTVMIEKTPTPTIFVADIYAHTPKKLTEDLYTYLDSFNGSTVRWQPASRP